MFSLPVPEYISMMPDSENNRAIVRFLTMGEEGLVAELGAAVDPLVNARVHHLASLLRRASIPGVRELVPTYRSLLVLFDPVRLSRDALRETVARLARDVEHGNRREAGRLVRIPVCYGDDLGPDLEFVARHNDLSPEEVIALHSGATYPVCMLGFLPGFPYLGGLPARLAAPRLATPRLDVAAGAVGIAGSQTGIYPLCSPGGWRIIGRTPLRLFDPERALPFLVSAGDRVRFDPVDRAEYERLLRCREGDRAQVAASPAARREAGVLTVLKPGLLTTVQDRGRFGYRAFGLSPGGAMDTMAAGVANLLAGNAPKAALLEMTLIGGTFRFESGAYAAVCGADMACRLNGLPVRNWSAFFVPAGAELSFGPAGSGCRAYLAVQGGISVPAVLGSRATSLRAAIGGIEGRALRAGDFLPYGEICRTPAAKRLLSFRFVPRYPDEITLRVLPGPQDDLFTAEGIDTFFFAAYTVTPHNDRMGYRLAGPPIRHRRGADITSDALCAGAVQVAGDGLPLVMTADHQATGGYAKIGAVIGPDLFRLAQARHGTRVLFVRCSDDEAVQALKLRDAQFAKLCTAVAEGAGR